MKSLSHQWRNTNPTTRRKVLWYCVLASFVLIVHFVAPDEAKAPLFAMISVTALSVGAVGSSVAKLKSDIDQLVDLLGLVVAYTSGVSSGWAWLQAEDVSIVWYGMGAILAVITANELLVARDSLLEMFRKRRK